MYQEDAHFHVGKDYRKMGVCIVFYEGDCASKG